MNTDLYKIMKVIVSLLILIPALCKIMGNKNNTNDKKWAYGVVGTILGYWLNSS